jgi:hypothetical protein
MSQLEDAPQGRIIGRWNGRHIPYALTRSLTGKRQIWARFGTLGWERLGELVDAPKGPELKREEAWQGHPLPDGESEIVAHAAAAAAG